MFCDGMKGRLLLSTLGRLAYHRPQVLRLHTAIQAGNQRVCCRFLKVPRPWRPVPARRKTIMSKTPQHFKANNDLDKIPQNFELIYTNNMNRYYFYSQVIIYSTLTPAICGCVYLIWKNRLNLSERLSKEEADHPYFMAIPGLVFAVSLMWFTNAVSRRAVLRMYHDHSTGKFVAVTQQWNMRRINLYFVKKNCIPQPKSSNAKMLLGGNVKIHSWPFLIRDTDFRQPMYYNMLMGYERAEEDRSDHSDLHVKKRS